MPFEDLDRPAVARSLSQIADHPDDLVDAYFERRQEMELPPDGEAPGLRVRREEGFAVRLVREGRTWLASRDGLDSRDFHQALRQVARVLPAAAYPEPRLGRASEDGAEAADAGAAGDTDLLEFPSRLQRAIRRRHVAFPFRLTVRHHRRSVQVVGLGPLPESQEERFYSLEAELPWSRHGALLTDLGPDAVEGTAESLVAYFRSRHAAPPEPGRGVLVLGPAAAAVLLHEAVAHALEADVLAQGGDPEAAVGVEMGSPLLSVLDDPASAPEGARRESDDEGQPVTRRWLLRKGVVVAPLADSVWAAGSDSLAPGAARRGDRHSPPGPRSTFLELLAGETAEDDLGDEADGALWAPEASRGRLDPLSGRFELELPFGRRIRSGAPADAVGPFRLVGSVAGLLSRVVAVGAEPRSAGAGWCAKGGQKMAVWARAPALRLDGARIEEAAGRPRGAPAGEESP